MSSATPSKPWQRTTSSSDGGTTSVKGHSHSNSLSGPKLTSDASHVPKTHGSVGILVIGLGGANGTTMLAGILANRKKTEWFGPRGEGPIASNYNGCITQLNQKGIHGGVGYKDKVVGLADANMAAVGGWDIRPTKLGDALLEAQILDYDLVKQVKDDMNNTAKYPVFKGLYDERFIGSSQHATATHVLSPEEVPNAREALKCIRADIRYFKWKNGVVGHTTVIWSASVEPNIELCYPGGGLDTAQQLLDSIEMTEEERGSPLPPSLIYATAAILEGCSFVNGGSQNTMCPGLAELAKQQLGVYCLGTDFKAGQTKFKTAAVEYLRTMGLTPKVIASSNHLGNNDMCNLDTGGASMRKAKLRVKSDIFAPWEEEIDHKVSVMYCPMINDEKRDFVEYTSLGFMAQHHTMVTYTRASDSVLCVPLMIDAAVFCDYFSRKSWSYENVAKGLAYLFKVPEGAAKGVDPGFFRQMQELDKQVMSAAKSDAKGKGGDEGSQMQMQRHVKFKENNQPDQDVVTEWAIPNNLGIVCAGLACVDMQLLSSTGGDGGEAIETFQGETSMAGGSVSMACKNLARLCHVDPLDDVYMQITPPVVSNIVPLCKAGFDNTGNKLISLLEATATSCRNVDTKFMKNSRGRDSDPNARTGLAVLPIYQDGRRGCFFDAGSNATFAASEMVEMIEDVKKNSSADNGSAYGAFLFGYPHLLPEMQGEALAHVFSKARSMMEDGGIVVLDLNGVPDSSGSKQTPYGSMCTAADLKSDVVIGPALSHVDILHMNEDEVVSLTGVKLEGDDEKDKAALSGAASMFLKCGVAVVAITRGKSGCFIKCNNEERFSSSKMLPATWVDQEIHVGASLLPAGTDINSNGAGDSFTCGLLVAALIRHTGLCLPVESTTPFKAKSPAANEGASTDSLDGLSTSSSSSPTKKLTPYSLYMRENYVALKQQCSDDKKAIFSRCHEMWAAESDENKQMYERRCKEEIEKHDAEAAAVAVQATPPPKAKRSDENDVPSRNLHLANQPMNLETAAQFASLVAARHIDMSTRNLTHVNINRIREESTVSAHGLEEI